MSIIGRLSGGTLEAIGAATGSLTRLAHARGQIYFPFASHALSILPFASGERFRRAALSRALRGGVGAGSTIHGGVVFDDEDCAIGADVWISQGVYIEKAQIEDHALIGPHAVLLAANQYHRFDRTDLPIKQQGNLPRQALRIGRGAWIGANATVMADVGHDAIVGAGAVVTRPVPPWGIVVGNPARLLRMRREDEPRGSFQSMAGEASR